MKKLIYTAVLGIFMFSIMPAYAAKGASEMGQTKASDQAIFNRVGDWFATVGKSNEEKAQIKSERQAQRVAKKAEKDIMKKKKSAQKAAMEELGEGESKMDKFKKKMKGFKKDSKKKGSGMKGSEHKGS